MRPRNRSETLWRRFRQVPALCENGNEEAAHEGLWSGKPYSSEGARAAREANARCAA